MSWDPAQEQPTGVYAGEVILVMMVNPGPGPVVFERAVEAAITTFTNRFPGVDVTVA